MLLLFAAESKLCTKWQTLLLAEMQMTSKNSDQGGTRYGHFARVV